MWTISKQTGYALNDTVNRGAPELVLNWVEILLANPPATA